MSTLLALDEQVQRALALARDIPGYAAIDATSCPECGCRWVEHYPLAPFYMPNDPFNLADVIGPATDITCTGCADCCEAPPTRTAANQIARGEAVTS